MEGPYRKLLLAKIHGARVTEANVNYEGSITIPQDLLALSGMLPHESVHVWNVTRGTRFETYILEGVHGSQEFHVNGAAAHLVEVGDVLIIAAFTFLPAANAEFHQPRVVFLNPDNTLKNMRSETPRTVVA